VLSAELTSGHGQFFNRDILFFIISIPDVSPPILSSQLFVSWLIILQWVIHGHRKEHHNAWVYCTNLLQEATLKYSREMEKGNPWAKEQHAQGIEERLWSPGLWGLTDRAGQVDQDQLTMVLDVSLNNRFM
jgi:hypothetical protein